MKAGSGQWSVGWEESRQRSMVGWQGRKQAVVIGQLAIRSGVNLDTESLVTD